MFSVPGETMADPPHSGISLPRRGPVSATSPGPVLLFSGGLGGPRTRLQTEGQVESPGSPGLSVQALCWGWDTWQAHWCPS